MARLFTISLIAFKIVDGSTDRLPRILTRTNRMDHVADHQQSLKRHHYFIVFHIVAHKHEDLLYRHGPCLSCLFLLRRHFPVLAKEAGGHDLSGCA
jgi:hypothetical protein